MPQLLLQDARYTYVAATPGEPLWNEALAMISDTYRRNGIKIHPPAAPTVLRTCCLKDGALVGTAGARHVNFTCAQKFPAAFAREVGDTPVLELTQFAVHAANPGRVMLTLIHLLYFYACQYRARHLVCEVHPEHASFYATAGFREMDRLEGEGIQPAAFLHTPLERMSEQLACTGLRHRGVPQAEQDKVRAQFAALAWPPA